MAIDTSQTLEIRTSLTKMLGLLAAGAAMTAGSAAVAFPQLTGIETGSFTPFAGYIGILFFGLCIVVALGQLLAGGAVVTLAPEGFRDTRVAAEMVPWSAVQKISTWEHTGQKVMVVAIDPAVESRLRLTTIARMSRGANRALGADGLCIAAQGLQIDYDTLYRTAIAYAQAWHAG